MKKIIYTLVMLLCLSVIADAQKLPWEGNDGSASGKLNLTFDGKKIVMDDNCSDNYAEATYLDESLAQAVGKSRLQDLKISFFDDTRTCVKDIQTIFDIALPNFKGVGSYQIKEYPSRLSFVYDETDKSDPTLNRSWSADRNSPQSSATVNITEYTPTRIAGNFSGLIGYRDDIRKVSGDFVFVKTKTRKDSRARQVASQDAAASRNDGANENGEYLNVSMNGKPISFGSNCSFYRGKKDGTDVELFVNEDQCEDVMGRKPFNLTLQMSGFKGKGIYKVSRARALRTGDLRISVGGTSDEQYETEVDAGGLATVTITNVAGGFIEGTFTANLVNVSAGNKKASFTGKFKFKAQ